MREISFRAWIANSHWIANDKSFYVYEWQETIYVDSAGFNPGDGVIIEQFTGLKDSEGNKIFEGDKISFTVFDCFDNDTQYVGVVKFTGGTWYLCNPLNDSGGYGSDGPFCLHWVANQDDTIKVTGNIHE